MIQDSKVHDAHMITDNDNVATVVRCVHKGEKVKVKGTDIEKVLESLSEIPAGHKIALVDIAKDYKVIKYNEVIGKAINNIYAGEHVHLHNLDGTRARGDLE